jgi:hypothetical protein
MAELPYDNNFLGAQQLPYDNATEVAVLNADQNFLAHFMVGAKTAQLEVGEDADQWLEAAEDAWEELETKCYEAVKAYFNQGIATLLDTLDESEQQAFAQWLISESFPSGVLEEDSTKIEEMKFVQIFPYFVKLFVSVQQPTHPIKLFYRPYSQPCQTSYAFLEAEVSLIFLDVDGVLNYNAALAAGARTDQLKNDTWDKTATSLQYRLTNDNAVESEGTIEDSRKTSRPFTNLFQEPARRSCPAVTRPPPLFTRQLQAFARIHRTANERGCSCRSKIVLRSEHYIHTNILHLHLGLHTHSICSCLDAH